MFPICTVLTSSCKLSLSGDTAVTWSPYTLRRGFWVLANILFLTGVNAFLELELDLINRLSMSFSAIFVRSDGKKVAYTAGQERMPVQGLFLLFHSLMACTDGSIPLDRIESLACSANYRTIVFVNKQIIRNSPQLIVQTRTRTFHYTCK